MRPSPNVVLLALYLTTFAGALTAVATRSAAAETPSDIDFNRDVRPILSDRCFHCHGPDATNQDSEFRLDTREHATADLGGDYFGVFPGSLEKSELHARIYASDDSLMPPADSNRKLSKEEKEILDRWIMAGAPFDVHWAYRRIPDRTPVPNAGDGWAANDVDRFIAAAHREQGFTENGPLAAEKWLRRVTFDLTGLPPTLEELDAFLEDTSDGARERVVDRLLASDACAERLTSEWLDVARYSDSYGYQRDDERFVWPYRDWVIRAFKQNKPYDEFITEQLAGDLLPGATREQRLATVFNRLHSHKKEGGVAIEEFRVENVADRTHTVASAFLGLTMECSRCHDHKYDPITQKDYYSLSSFFANVDENGLISYFTNAVPTPAMSLPSDKQRAEIDAAREALARAEAECAAVPVGEDFEAWLRDGRESLLTTQGASPGSTSGDQAASVSTNSAKVSAARSDAPAVSHDPSQGADPGLTPKVVMGALIPGLVAELSFDEFVERDPDAPPELDKNGKPIKPSASDRFLANPVGRQGQTKDLNTLVEGRFGNAILLNGDDAVEIPEVGHFARHQPFTVSLWFHAPDVTERSVLYRRSRGWDDAGSVGYELTKQGDTLVAKLCHFWPGDAIAVETTEPLEAERWYQATVTYDGSSKASGLKIYLDGRPAESRVVVDHLTRNITYWRSGYDHLAIGSRYRDRGFVGGKVDDFRVYDRELAAVEVTQLFDRKTLTGLLSEPAEDLAEAKRSSLRAYFVAAGHHEPTNAARKTLAAARKRLNDAVDAAPAITVMREQATPRPAYILNRGVYDDHGEEVTADTPEFLPPFPEDAPRNRLGLAEWLTSPDQPLVARVAVNRYWQLVFGSGLVRTPEDFGNQSAPPTHPELLDWLARDFISHGWDVRRMLRMLVLSATYAQDSVVPPAKRTQDPENVWLARGPAERLTAEMIRDNALAVSGLLVPTVGGPPVKPYDVALGYKPLEVDSGGDLYRRSLYTFWKRTSPAPVMMTMNAGKRDVCRLRRDITQSPLQALVLLNGQQFVEASRVFAASLLQEYGTDADAVARDAFRRFTSRKATDDEAAILRQLFEEQQAAFAADPALASELLQAGDAAPADGVTPVDHAAATVLVNTIMNFSESVRLQ